MPQDRKAFASIEQTGDRRAKIALASAVEKTFSQKHLAVSWKKYIFARKV